MIVLNFHGLGPLTRDVDPGERDCWLETDHFEAILDRIQGNGTVLLTFDDGNSSDVEIALPILEQRGLKADFFICSGRLGAPTFVDEDGVRLLQKRGMGIGSHGIDHIPWRNAADETLHEELRSSRDVLERVCGRAIDTAACPFGSYDGRVLKALRAAGYKTAYTSDGGPSSGRGLLKARNTMKRNTTPEEVDRILALASNPVSHLVGRARQTMKLLRPSPAIT